MSDAAPDEALLAAYVAGDARAFVQLYDRHERALYRYFVRQGAVAAVADDLLQETWLAVVRNAARFEPRARFTTWLYTVARSKMIDHWRARGDDAVSLTAWVDAEAANDAGMPAVEVEIAADDTHRPDRQTLARAEARAFLTAVEALPPAQRDAFLLQTEGGLSIDQIARVSGATHETVKSRLRYAMSKLRLAMEAWQ